MELGSIDMAKPLNKYANWLLIGLKCAIKLLSVHIAVFFIIDTCFPWFERKLHIDFRIKRAVFVQCTLLHFLETVSLLGLCLLHPTRILNTDPAH